MGSYASSGGNDLIVLRRRLPLWLVGGAAFLLPLLTWGLPSLPVRAALREWSLDMMPPTLPSRKGLGLDVAIADIDAAALDRFGPWPWPRARLAQLVNAVAKASPAVIVLDMLLDGPDRFSPTAFLDLVPDPDSRARLAGAVGDFADGDAQLRDALFAAPSVLGMVLEIGGPGKEVPVTPILLSSPVAIPDLWRADGVIGPDPRLAAAAQGFGTLVAAPDFDGRIRRVPLLVVAGGILRPGLAVEAVRLAQRASALFVQGDGRLRAGNVLVPLAPDATLRLFQPEPSAWAPHTIAVSRLLDGSETPTLFTGRIVLIGSSAPELGGLRVTPASPVTPSVQIQAEAIAALSRGDVAIRPTWLGPVETTAAVCLGLLCVLFAYRMRPAFGAGLALLLCIGWSVAALIAAPALGVLVDPAGPALISVLIYCVSALVRFVGFEWRARLLRARFEQHLSPDVVRRIASDPGSMRLKGELREVTAVFADIEGFTAMTERADPAELVALLDAYFDAVTNVVTAHGGMVDKIVGDAVRALFNVPFSLADHAARGVSCALEILVATEAVRGSALGRRLMLGRTRIGVETGVAIVGDVGGARKLDYTALGNPINTAARLEEANKELGSSICIGPGAAAQIDPALLRPIGVLALRGQGRPVRVFTPAAPSKLADR
jgi:adenylate cyclase